ncbi:Uncharacterised protein [Vibrio cholerae]|nr:Uncharacterised protein [Vibrio cholerae]
MGTKTCSHQLFRNLSTVRIEMNRFATLRVRLSISAITGHRKDKR